MEIGKRLREIKDAKGWTTNRLAMESGLSQSFLRSVELGEKGISVENLQVLCDALGISMKEFFNLPDDRQVISINHRLHQKIDQLTPKQKEQLFLFLDELL